MFPSGREVYFFLPKGKPKQYQKTMKESKRIKVPTSWRDVSLSTYKRLQQLEKTGNQLQDAIATAAILCDQDVKTIASMEMPSFKKLVETLSWSSQPPKTNRSHWKDPETQEVYHLVDFSKLSIGAWIDIEQQIKTDSTSLERFAAILFQKKNEVYDSERLEERAQIFSKRMDIECLNSCTSFFLTFAQVSTGSSAVSSESPTGN